MMKFRIGYGYDVHALGEGLPLILGGVEIEHAKGCIAHSDGDVVLHAISDALLGAAALGDIGLESISKLLICLYFDSRVRVSK